MDFYQNQIKYKYDTYRFNLIWALWKKRSVKKKNCQQPI